MKKLLIMIIVFTITLSFSACLDTPADSNPTSEPTQTDSSATDEPTQTPEPTTTSQLLPTAAPTAEPTPTEAPTAVPQLEAEEVMDSGTNVFAYGGGEGTIYFDLNCDGTDDEITYQFYDYSGWPLTETFDLTSPYGNMIDQELYQCNLTVNGQPIIIQGDNLAGLIIISDIDFSDSQYEILIPEFGPSGDPFTTFVAYNGIAPLNIGKVYSNPFFDLLVDGSGEISGTKRGSILHTWFYDAVYEISGGLISEVIGADGYVMMDTDITALIDLPLQMSPTDPTVAFTLETGEHATITWTDDESWCCIETASGLSGWFEITGYSTINGTESFYVFDGLCMAD